MEERGTPSGINRARIHPAREMLAGARLIRCFRGRARDYWHSPWERPSNAPGMQPCARPASTHTAALQSQSDMTMQKTAELKAPHPSHPVAGLFQWHPLPPPPLVLLERRATEECSSFPFTRSLPRPEGGDEGGHRTRIRSLPRHKLAGALR
jgi:hypothetical protein